MPPHSDEPITSLTQDVLQAFNDLNGRHPGFRPAHAKGVFLTGFFTPAQEAASLTRAPHALRESTPVTVRFSDFAGFPAVADNDPNNASPRGIAIRFHLAAHEHTDIVAHSADGFPARTGEEFLEFLHALKASPPDTPHPAPIEVFLGSHPAALAFVQMPKPFPTSFVKESYFAVTALRFINGSGEGKFGRFRVRPEGGADYLRDASEKAPNYLVDEITERVATGPVKLRIVVQVAAPGDVTDDATVHWPEDRTNVPFGMVTLTGRIPNDDADVKRIIFDPIPRVDGVEPSGDPLLAVRANIYLRSGRRRRAGDPSM
ncbi:MAG TPA: catalase family peroxidase [Bryobacteraceae bacterium]|nr:catalase family peroxidase [Bryobacteraceae bacterium]